MCTTVSTTALTIITITSKLVTTFHSSGVAGSVIVRTILGSTNVSKKEHFAFLTFPRVHTCTGQIRYLP